MRRLLGFVRKREFCWVEPRIEDEPHDTVVQPGGAYVGSGAGFAVTDLAPRLRGFESMRMRFRSMSDRQLKLRLEAGS